MKKALSLILMLVMVFSALVPSMVLAAEEINALSRVNLVAGKEYTISEQYRMGGADVGWGYDENAAPSYPDSNYELTDGVLPAEATYSDAAWMAFSNNTPAQKERGYAYVRFDLGEVHELSDISFVTLKQADAGINCPYVVEALVSNDGTEYVSAGVLELTTEDLDALADNTIHTFAFDVVGAAQYVEIRVTSYGWAFLGEIEIYGEGVDVPVEPEVQKTYENTLVKGDNGNYSCEVPYGYTWEVDYINGKIGGEDVTICTTQDAYNASNPNWAITIYAELQEDGTYVALKNAIVTPGSAAGAGISIGEGQIAIVVHSSASNPDAGDYPNWLGKVVAMSVKAGDVLVVDMDGMTVYAPIPGEEIVLPEPPVAELPEGAIALDYAGYVHDSYFEILAGDNMTVAELTALGIGAEKDMNYFVVAVVGADGVITEMHTALGRPDGVKSDVVCPEGGYIIGLNGNKAGYEALLSANVGDSVKLYNVDVDSFRGAEGSIALENAGFVIEAFIPENFKTEIIVGDNACLTDGFKDLTDSWASGVPAGKIVLAANGNCKEVGMDTAIVYALGETKSIDSVALYFYVDAGSMIGYPEGTAIVSVSVDGENYNVVDKFEIAEVDYSAPSTAANVFEFDAVEAAYVKVDVYSGSNEAVRGDAEWDGKVNWEFISLVEVEVSEVEVEPEPELPEGALKIDISHVNAYTWGVYNEMVIYGEGENSMSKLGYDCTWWLAFKVENIDGVYTVTEIEGNGETKDMVAPADGFLVYCFSNDAASYEAATKLSVGATLYLANFDWTQSVASETPVGQLYFVPFSYGENVALGKPVQNADKRPTYNADLTDGVAIGNLTYNAADWFGFYWNPGMDLEGNLGQSTNAMYGIANPVVDLGGLYDLTTVRLNLFTGNNSGITAPETVTLKVSVDGIHYEEIEVVGFEWPESGSSKVEWVDFTLPEGTVAQYVCLEMVMRTTFVFINEIEVYGTESDEVPAIEHNLVHVDAVAPGCHYAGNVEYWYCTVCETVWTDEALTQISNHKSVIVPELGGEVIHVEAVANGCGYEGNIEYWYCEECEQVWADEARTQLTNFKNVILPALEHEIVHIEAVEPGCHYTGNVEHWYCTECDTVWTDEALTQISNHKSVIVPELGGEVVHVEAKDATCHEEGNIEYWYCEECEQVWADEARTQLTNFKNVITPATHGLLVHMDAVAPGCHMNGNIEYWICYECEQVWADEALTQLTNIKNVVLPATGEGNLVHMDAVEPGCHYTGNVEYWICYECEQVWTDEALTQLSNIKNVIVPELGGEVIHVEAKDATCYEEGNIEYWYCEECEQVWADEARTQLTNFKNVITPAEHGVVYIEAVEPGCHYTGNVEHWYCTECDTVWTDEALTQISNHKSVIVPELGGEVVHVEAKDPTYTEYGNIEYWYCEECGQVWQDEARTQLTNRFNVIIPMLIHSVEVNVNDLPILTDGKTGFDGDWGVVGGSDVYLVQNALCQQTGMEVVVLYNLGEVKKINAFALHFYHCAGVMIGYPEGAVILEYSVDGENYETIGYYDLAASDVAIGNHNTVVTNCEFDAVEAAYIRATVYAGSSTDVLGETPADNKIFWEFISIAEVEVSEAPAHNIVHIEAVEPGCHYTGNVEHWYCIDCETVWTDEALTQISNHMNVIVPAVGGEVVHVEAVAPTYTELGNIEYWYCEECEQVWQDEALTQLTNFKNVVLPMLPPPNLAAGKEWYGDTDVGSGYVGDLTDGVIDPNGKYDTSLWYGADNRKATDGVFTMIIDLGALCDIDETNIHVWPAGYSGIMIPGSIDFYVSVDGENFVLVESITEYDGTDPQWVGTSADVVARYVRIDMTNGTGGVFWFASEIEIYGLEHTHDVVHMEAVAPGCHYTGNVEHWYCTGCETVWADEALTQITNHKNVIVPELGGEVVHVEAKDATCYEEGNIEYWYCEECEQVWADEARTQLTNFKNVITPATHGLLVHMDAVAPGCHMNGNIEYWICYECEQVWADEALTQLTNIKNVVLPATGEGNLVHMDAVEPGCHYTGNVEYWICYECEQVWTDEALTQLSNIKNVIVPEIGGEVVHVDAKAPSCMEEGNIEYWYCEECEQVWADEARTQLTNFKNVILGVADHTLVHVDAVAPGCHYTGNVEHWYCTVCDTVWTDEALTQISNHMSVILPATGEGNLVHMDAVAPGCHMNGNIEYWICYDCEQVWADEALTQLTNIKNVVLPATGEGNLVHMDAVEPGCHYTGNVEYWICYECEQVWTDEALTQLSNIKNVIIPELGGEVVHVEAVAPACGVNGNIEHWYCEECGQVWADEARTQLTNHMSVILPALEHEFDAEGICGICGGESDLLISVVPGVDEANPGETFTVEIMLDRNNGFAHLSLDVLFNADVLELVEVTNGALFENFAYGAHLVWSAAENVTESGVLVTLTFKVKKGVTAGDCEITLVCNEAWNSDELPATVVLTGSSVAINDVVYGDVNGDGKINATDVTRLLRYLANRDPMTGESNVEIFAGADVTGDGKTNAADVTRLLRYLANRDPMTGESDVVLGPTK